MRPGRLAPVVVLAVAATLALESGGCSSDESTTVVDSGPNKCLASGATCALNYPFVCSPGFEPVTSGERATACGKDESSGKQMPCCIPSTPTDTGVDTGSDTGTEVGSDAAGDSASDAADADAGDATDAPSDATDGGGGG